MNVGTGRFISQDTYEGNSEDPLSLHKYLYASADGVNKLDPSGNFSLNELSISNVVSNILDFGRGVLNFAKAKATVENIYFAYAISQIAIAFLFPTYVNDGIIFEAKLFESTNKRFPDIGVEYRFCQDANACPSTVIRLGGGDLRFRLTLAPNDIVGASGGFNQNIYKLDYGLVKFKIDLTYRVSKDNSGKWRASMALEFKAEDPSGFLALTHRVRFYSVGSSVVNTDTN